MELDLRAQLGAAQAKAYAEHDRAVLSVTEHYRSQMPAVKDAIWEVAWRRCLTKLGIEESSPLWTDMELPSVVVSSQLASEPQPNPESESATPPEQVPSENTITDLTVEQESVPEGDNPVPQSATDASQLSEEA